jgi:hypothetical protein
MKTPDTIKNYFDKKAFNKWKLEWNEVSGIETVVVIPAISEFENIQNLLKDLSENKKTFLSKSLILFVINNLCSSNEDVKADNQKSISFIRDLILKNKIDPATDSLLQSGIIIGLVDAASQENDLNDKTGGVGTARKIGMDLALTAFDYSNSNKKIIVSLDADCRVDSNYLSSIINTFNKKNLNAAAIDFSHRNNSHSSDSTILGYEIFLRHYVVGLLYANSEFAFHTIGSAFACEASNYAKVGGMNTRQAAEDFYFLQKLSKVCKIGKINNTTVQPSARISWRVPFGTGKSVMQFQSGEKQLLLYDPEVFNILKHWLELLYSDYSLSTETTLIKSKSIHTELFNFLKLKGFQSQWEKILSNCKSEKQLNYQRKNWFDAFTTLKLIHHLRDTSFPMLELNSAAKKMFRLLNIPLVNGNEDENKIEALEKYLLMLKEIEDSFTKKSE